MLDLEQMVLFGIAAASLLEETLEHMQTTFPPAQIHGADQMLHVTTHDGGQVGAGFGPNGKPVIAATTPPLGKMNARVGIVAGEGTVGVIGKLDF